MRRFRLKYTGGIVGVIAITILAFTVVLIPVAVVFLINAIAMVETP